MEIAVRNFWLLRKFVAVFFFLVVFGGSRRFRELRETGRIHFLQVSSKSEHVGPSYDEKTEKEPLTLLVIKKFCGL